MPSSEAPMAVLTSVAQRLTRLSRGTRGAIGLTGAALGLVVVLATPVGARSAVAWAYQPASADGGTVAENARCSVLGCPNPATTFAHYSNGEIVPYCGAHEGLAPKRKSSGLLGLVALPLGAIGLAGLLVGFAVPILVPLALCARNLTVGEARLVVAAELVAIPATWIGASLMRFLRALGS